MIQSKSATELPLQTNSILLIFSKSIERAGFYGLRMILVLYATGEVLQMSREEGVALAGTLTAIVTVAHIIGGLMGDLLLKSRNGTLVGNMLQMLGTFICCIPSSLALYIGIVMIGLGTGFYSSNIFAFFGKLYKNKEDTIDSAFTGFYTLINLGSFLGILLISYLFEMRPLYGFLGAGFLFLAAGVLVLVVRYNKTLKNRTAERSDISVRTKRIILFSGVSSLFWWAYNFGSEGNFEATNLLIENGVSYFSIGTLYSMGSYFIILFGVVGTFIWYILKISRFLKLILGCFFAAISFFLLLAITTTQMPNMILLTLCFGLFSIAEILITPTIYSLIVLIANPKYLATIYSLISLPSKLLIFVSGTLLIGVLDNATVGILIGLALFVMTAIIVLIFKRKFQAMPFAPTQIDEIGIPDKDTSR